VSDRALNEIYLPVFKAAVKDAGTWSLMTSYNKYEGDYTSHSHKLLSEILKEEWGFDGVVVSDCGSIHDTEAAVKAGMDMEFGTSGSYSNYYLADPYLAGLEEGKFDMNELDDKCRRVLRLIFRTAMNPERPFGSLCSDGAL
jgi:beta-glucosidase